MAEIKAEPGTEPSSKHTPRTEKPRGRRKTPGRPLTFGTTKKVKAHDENGDAGIGDRVSLMETRPTSATKRWRLVEVLERAK